MTPPLHVETHENLTSVWWIEDDGILCSISKKEAPELTRQQSITQLEDFKQLTGHRKTCMLLDISNSRPIRREDREFVSQELEKIVQALAFISKSALGKMVANLFLNLKPPPYPVRMFTDEHEARQWLRQYL